MKKIVTLVVLLSMGFANAQTQPTATKNSAAEQVTQEAGYLYSCATAKSLLGWKNITIVVKRPAAGSQMLGVWGHALMGNGLVKKIDLCDKVQVAQAMMNILDIVSNKQNLDWQYLQFVTYPNRQFQFNPLTTAEVLEMTQAAQKK